MGINKAPSFHHAPEDVPKRDTAIVNLTGAFALEAIEALSDFPSVTRTYDGMLSLVKTLTVSDAATPEATPKAGAAGVDFEALESSVASKVGRSGDGLKRFLCDLVFGDESVADRRDFPSVYRLLLLYFGRLPSRIPGFFYKKQAAEAFIASEGLDKEIPFTGFHHLPKTYLLRLDIKGSVKKRLEEGVGMLDRTESHYYGPILEVLNDFSMVHYVETAGDETVFLCDEPEVALEFARTIQERFVQEFATEGSGFSVEMGVTLNGPAYWGVTTDGRFMVGGPSYEKAGVVQKLGKKRGADDIAAASGIFVYDFDAPPLKIDDTPSLEEYEGGEAGASASVTFSGTTGTFFPGSAMRVPTVNEAVSPLTLETLRGDDPTLVAKLQKLLALLASTATDPEGALQDRERLYPESTILFLDFVPPVLNADSEPDDAKLQSQWEVFMQPIEEIVRRHGGVILYNSSEGKIIVLMGAFQSSPLRQERRAALCAAELMERFPQVLKRAICTQARLAQGPMAGSLNGAGLGIDFASRLLGVDVPGRLVMEHDFFKRAFAGSDLLFLNERAASCEVRDFGVRELISFEGVKAPAFEASSGIEHAQLLEGISAHIQGLIGEGAAPGVYLFYVQASLGISSDAFLEALSDHLARGDAVVCSPSEAVQSHRAYGFFREVLGTIFPTPDHFERFLGTHAGPHEVWRFLFREISSGRISSTLLHNSELVAENLCSLLSMAASERPLVLQLPDWSRLDAFSAPIALALLRQSPASGHMIFLSPGPLLEDLSFEGFSNPPAEIPLVGLDAGGLATLLSVELRVDVASLSPLIFAFYERMIGPAPWVPFLARGLTRFLVQEGYFEVGRSDFSRSTEGLTVDDVPSSFKHYVQSLYSEFPAPVQKVFKAAALLGTVGKVSALRVFSGVDAAVFDQALEALHLAGVLRATGDEYRFFHDFIPHVAPRIFVQRDSDSAVHEQVLADLCTLAAEHPLAVSPDVLLAKAMAAKAPQRIAPQIAAILESWVRDLPLDAETLAKQYLASLGAAGGGREVALTDDQRAAIFRVRMHLIQASAQLRRPKDEAIVPLLEQCERDLKHVPEVLKTILRAEFGVLVEDVGDIYRDSAVARQGIVDHLMGIPENALAGYHSTLRSGIEFAKARFKYRHEAVPTVSSRPVREQAARDALSRIESVLTRFGDDFFAEDRRRFEVLRFVIRGFLTVDLPQELLQGTSRDLSSEERDGITALVKDVLGFFESATDLSLRQMMDCVHILSKGSLLFKDFASAHSYWDHLIDRAEQDGQLGLKMRMINFKFFVYGMEMEALQKGANNAGIHRLAHDANPLIAFVYAHRPLLKGGDETLLIFYRNLIEFNAILYESYVPDDSRREQLRTASSEIFKILMPADCSHYRQTFSQVFSRASFHLARMNS